MTLPASWTLIPVSGTYHNLDGTPATGFVTFEANQRVVIDGQLVVPGIIRMNLDGTGSISGFLPSTNDPDLSVTGWGYTVTENIPNGRPRFVIEAPYTGGAINLITVPVAQPVIQTPVSSALHTTDIGVTVASQTAMAAEQAFTAAVQASSGASLVGFIQAGTGAVARTVQDKLREPYVSVFDFIPVAEQPAITARTSTYDCSTDIQEALTQLQSRSEGGVLFWPEGRYKMLTGVTYTGKPIRMEGEAPEMVVIDSHATGDLFQFNLTGGTAAVGGMAGATFDSCTIRSLVVTPKAISTGAAFHIDYTQDNGGFCFLLVENVRLCRETTTYFKHGLHLNDVGSGIIRNTTIYFYGDDSDTCIFIDNSLTVPSYGFKIESLDTNGADIGLKVNGWLESLYIGPGSAIVGATDAIVLDGTGTTFGCPHFYVSGAHLNSKRHTIKTTNWRAILLCGTDVYHGVGTGDVDGENLWIVTGQQVSVSGCKFETGTTLNRRGILLDGVTDYAISGNTFTGFKSNAISVIAATTDRGAITGNTMRYATGGGTQGIFLGGAANNVVVTGNYIEDYAIGVQATAVSSLVHSNTIKDATTGVTGNSGTDARFNKFINVTTETSGVGRREFVSTVTVDPPSVPAGGGATLLVAVAGVVLGDSVYAAAPYDMSDVIVTAEVQSAGNVGLYFWNRTGGAVDKASGSWKFYVTS